MIGSTFQPFQLFLQCSSSNTSSPSHPSHTMSESENRKHMIFVLYHAITWYAAPIVIQKSNMDLTDTHAHILGFLVSIYLYETYGKKYIAGV